MPRKIVPLAWYAPALPKAHGFGIPASGLNGCRERIRGIGKVAFRYRLLQTLGQSPVRKNEAGEFDVIRSEAIALPLQDVSTGGVRFLNSLGILFRSVLKERKLTDRVQQASR